MDYALIENGIVTNIIWLYPGNVQEFPNAVPMGDVPAGIGDSYIDGTFYRDGERVLTEAERAMLEAEKALEETAAAEAAYAEGVQLA